MLYLRNLYQLINELVFLNEAVQKVTDSLFYKPVNTLRNNYFTLRAIQLIYNYYKNTEKDNYTKEKADNEELIFTIAK